MKLRELQLNEMGDLIARQISHGIPLEMFKNFKKIGVLNEFDIEKSDLIEFKVCYKLTLDDADIFYFVGIEFDKNIQIQRTWMDKEYRNQGIATKFYKKLYLVYDFTLISDKQLSPESKSIWEKLFELYPNRIFLTDKYLQHFQKLEDFNDFFRNSNFLLTLKNENITLGESKIPQNLLLRVLSEYELGGKPTD